MAGRGRTNFLCDWILATVREFLDQKTERSCENALMRLADDTVARSFHSFLLPFGFARGSLELGQDDSIWAESVKTKVSRLFIDLNKKILAFESHKCYYNLFIYSILRRYQTCPRMA